MIFNRTISDVLQAEAIRKDKIQKGFEITATEIDIMEHGTLSLNTLNRIELKQEGLEVILREMGYYTIINNKQWAKNDIFTDSDLNRIVENNRVLRKAFYVYADTPMDAVARYHYEEFNALERVLFDLEKMIGYTKKHYRRCGELECGG